MTETLRQLTLYGCGGHARSVASTALASGFNSVIFIDEKARPDEKIIGFPVIIKPPAESADMDVFAAAGDNVKRELLYNTLQASTNNIVTVRHPSAIISPEAQLEDALFLGALCVIGPEAKIGANSIINTGAIIEHECSVGSHSHIAIGARMAGRSHIGARSFLGAGAIVIDGIRITDNVVIGAGSVVIKDITKPGTYVGIPARKL